MSYSKYERGRFIKSRMNHFILMALANEKIDSIEASRIFDLISEVETAGTTHSRDLVKEPFYLQALKDWQAIPEKRIRAHMVRQIQRLLKRALLMKIKEVKNEQNVRDRLSG